MSNFKKGALTEADKKIIKSQFGKIPIRELTKKLGRGGKIIYDYVRQENIASIEGSRDTRNHPWRKANYQLELNKKIYQ